MAAWESHAVIAILVGYQIAVFGTVTSSGFIHNQPLIIIAFLLYTLAALIAALIKFGDAGSNFVNNISSIILLCISGKYDDQVFVVFFAFQNTFGLAIVNIRYQRNANLQCDTFENLSGLNILVRA
jgi:hypothetical protein